MQWNIMQPLKSQIYMYWYNLKDVLSGEKKQGGNNMYKYYSRKKNNLPKIAMS